MPDCPVHAAESTYGGVRVPNQVRFVADPDIVLTKSQRAGAISGIFAWHSADRDVNLKPPAVRQLLASGVLEEVPEMVMVELTKADAERHVRVYVQDMPDNPCSRLAVACSEALEAGR